MDNFSIGLLFLLAIPLVAPYLKKAKWFGAEFTFRDEINKLEGNKIIYIFALEDHPVDWDKIIERLEKDKTIIIKLIPEGILMAYNKVINMP